MCSGVCEGWNEDGVKATKAWCANINYLKGYMRVRNLNAFQTKSCTHETKPLCDQKPKDPSECFQQATSFRSYLCHRLTQILQRCRSQLSRARSKRQAIRPRSSNAAHIHQRPESLTLTPQIRLHIYCQSALTLAASTCKLRVVSFFCSFAFFMLPIMPMILSTSRFMSGASLAVKVFGGT
jgi:hypothetical protein